MTKDTKIEKIIKDYAHDFRDMAMNEVQLEGVLIGFKNALQQEIKEVVELGVNSFINTNDNGDEYINEIREMKDHIFKTIDKL